MDKNAGAGKIRDIYALKPGAPFYQKEFGFFTLDKWKSQGLIPQNKTLEELFGFDSPGQHYIGGLGWCEAEFDPWFEEKIIEDRGDHELVQDVAGRQVLFFKGRRSGFMPEYLSHPVKDPKTWSEQVRWRLNPATPSRYANLGKSISEAQEAANRGLMIVQSVVGGYMYLRSLFGPGELPYYFYDMPDLIHECMETWFALADAVTAKHQQFVTIDELYFGEDICYNHGLLLSPSMVKEFLFPYYRRLIANVRSRQIDKTRRLFFHLDTDGFAIPAINLYLEIGLDVMDPFEVASGCDVVKIGKEFPGLVMSGGIDKRILAQGKEAIDRHLDYILPAMHKRGGYFPTCDHGVPEEVSFDNYMYYRKRCLEYS
ncbi:MAG: hypothetical protein NTY10_02345 [Candidatus Omnitrophica bacterium]|nr:hypothetical protein [Candidatus Omnitrophota bacterium]